jgi:hypothetical protein
VRIAEAAPARLAWPSQQPVQRVRQGVAEIRQLAKIDPPPLPGGVAAHSHSIINETCKLLIFNAPEAAPQKFSVIFPVKVRSSSIGEGFRAVRPKLSFRDLSTRANIADNIGARPGRSRNRLTSAGIELIKLLS